MVFCLPSKLQYDILEKSEPIEDDFPHDEHARYSRLPSRKHNVRVATGIVLLSCMSAAAVCAIALGLFTKAIDHDPIVACTQPSLRQEWRTLTDPEKLTYIQAVQCLSTKPSKSVANDTLYDDFPRVHELTSPTAHKSAPFLPWHRYYIHSYETALKDCGYSGSLPYWDWSQDWNEFENSPIWSSEIGFGGNGVGVGSIGEGSCVVDGPFAGLEARYYADEIRPHCLSRGFSKGKELKELANLISPNAITDILREKSFDSFAPKLEVRAHRFISGSIKGDFSKYTGPYDPVFFLHHANIDRLWSKWQQSDKSNRYLDYGGKAGMGSDSEASVNDQLDIGGLMEKTPVKSVMETTSGLFCYTYA